MTTNLQKKYNRIVCVDHTKLQNWALEELQEYSENQIKVFDDYPATEEEVVNRIGAANAVLVSWHTQISRSVIEACPNLEYIGMCCSLYDDASANVAVNFARDRGIAVKGIRDYGDPGVIEFIISELVRLLHGFGDQQWKDMPLELTGRKIGIIGLGTTGTLLAKSMQPLGVNLYYFSRTRKPEWEQKGLEYRPLNALLQETEIISLHLPRNTKLLKKEEFELLGSGKILINTSLGLPFEKAAFNNWITDSSNFGIFDGDGKKELDPEIEKLPSVLTVDKSAGWSRETAHRLSKKVLANLREDLDSQK